MTDLEHQSRSFLHGRKVCATGQFFSLTKAELGDFIRGCGGEFYKSPVRYSMLIVVGSGGLPEKNGNGGNRILERAKELQAYGYQMEFISEPEFLERAGLAD